MTGARGLAVFDGSTVPVAAVEVTQGLAEGDTVLRGVVGAAAVYCLIVWRFGLLKNFDLANLKYEQKNISN